MKIDDGLELPPSQPVNLKIIDSLCFNKRQKENSQSVLPSKICLLNFTCLYIFCAIEMNKKLNLLFQSSRNQIWYEIYQSFS